MRAGVGRRRADVGGLDLDLDEVKRDAAGSKCDAGEDELCAASHEYDPGERECSAVGLKPVSDGVGDLPGGHKWRSEQTRSPLCRIQARPRWVRALPWQT